MKISIGNVTLLDHSVPLSAFAINGRVVTQLVDFPRADSVTIFNRANRQNNITFTAVRTHASNLAAEAFMLIHSTDVLEQGHITFESKGANNQTVQRYLANAILSVVDGSHIGCTTFHQYQIIGGKMLIQKPS